MALDTTSTSVQQSVPLLAVAASIESKTDTFSERQPNVDIVTNSPLPQVSQPEAVYHQPEPVYHQPEPVYHQPEAVLLPDQTAGTYPVQVLP